MELYRYKIESYIQDIQDRSHLKKGSKAGREGRKGRNGRKEGRMEKEKEGKGRKTLALEKAERCFLSVCYAEEMAYCLFINNNRKVKYCSFFCQQYVLSAAVPRKFLGPTLRE